MLQNSGFENGWQDLPPTESGVTNQQPNGWRLAWVARGQSLYDDPGATASETPICVHMLSRQLPPHEQLGAADALILDGGTTYKIFHARASFGATLSQTISGLAPGSTARLVVPVRAHYHGDRDPFSAEAGVWVNGQGGWANGDMMGDRKWYRHTVDFVVPPDGRAEIVIRVKSKWVRPKDFFLDALSLEARVAAPAPPPPTPVTPPPPAPVTPPPAPVTPPPAPVTPPAPAMPPPSGNVVVISVPEGLGVVRKVDGDATDMVWVIVPPGVEVQVETRG